MARTLHLACYDVRDPRRLARTTRYLGAWRVAGQKSVPELWLTPAELGTIQRELSALLHAGEDRLQIVALDPRMKPRCLGQAATFAARHFCIV